MTRGGWHRPTQEGIEGPTGVAPCPSPWPPGVILLGLIPTALFYFFFITFELKWAIVAALGWTYAAMGRRVLTGTRVSGLLVLAALGISVQLVPIPHSSPSTLPPGSPDAVLRWRCAAS